MTTLSDLDVLALTIWGEARNQSLAGMAAVAAVIRNRLQSGQWGRSYESVCLAPKQFSCWTPIGGKANHGTLRALVGQIQQGKAPDDPVLKRCYWIAQGCLSGVLPDETSGSMHYFVTKSPMPSWAKDHLPVAVIGSHSFFNDVE